jgi:hypothetical protein
MIKTTRLIVLSVLFLATYASAQPLPATTSSVLIQRERDLMRALTLGQHALLNQLVTDDVSCRVTGSKPLALKPPAARYTLCTAMGNDLSKRFPRAAYVESAEKNLPRIATIDTIDIEPLDAATVVVISTQTYGNWFPYDGSFHRRAEVRDTWTLRQGSWLLKERITKPLEEPVAALR